MPASIQVKYLLAPSVSEKFNITWANQTFGASFESDGRLQSTPHVNTISCDQSVNTCSVTILTPSVALIFFTSKAFLEANPSAVQSFPTTATPQTANTVTIELSVLVG